MKPKNRLGVFLGVVSILFSAFCLIVMPVFTGAIIAALFVGLVLGAIAAGLKVYRIAGATLLFALVPLCGFLVLQNVAGARYVALVALVVAVALAARLALDHSRTKSA